MPDQSPTTDNTVALAAHADDAYCALCRRCQMRKKLERRLATRRRGTTTDNNAEHGGLVSVPRDERPIAELLDYIGEDNASEGGVNRSGRRARRKRAAAMRRRALAEKDNVVVVATPSTSEDGVACGDCDGEDVNNTNNDDQQHHLLHLHHANNVESDNSSPFLDIDDDEDVDREVEEFRRLLEAAHVNRPAARRTTCLGDFSR